MSQSKSTVLLRHQKKERLRRNNDKTNATYETPHTTKEELKQGTALERSVCVWHVRMCVCGCGGGGERRRREGVREGSFTRTKPHP